MRDQREHHRALLNCAVTLWNPRDGTLIEAVTHNISCKGFCCRHTGSCIPGDEYYAAIEIGSSDKTDGQNGLSDVVLYCKGIVTRTTIAAENGWWDVAFRIEDCFVARAPHGHHRSEALSLNCKEIRLAQRPTVAP